MDDVRVDIDNLSLVGADLHASQAQDLARMTEAALQSLLARRPLPEGHRGGDVAGIEMAEAVLPIGAGTGEVAQELARSIYRALYRTR